MISQLFLIKILVSFRFPHHFSPKFKLFSSVNFAILSFKIHLESYMSLYLLRFHQCTSHYYFPHGFLQLPQTGLPTPNFQPCLATVFSSHSNQSATFLILILLYPNTSQTGSNPHTLSVLPFLILQSLPLCLSHSVSSIVLSSRLLPKHSKSHSS